jgi:hypothetical protein
VLQRRPAHRLLPAVDLIGNNLYAFLGGLHKEYDRNNTNTLMNKTREGLMSEIIKIKAASPVVIEITNRNNFFIPSSF